MTASGVPPLEDYQRWVATITAMHIRNGLEALHGGGSLLDHRAEGGEYRGLTDEQMALINPIVRNAIAEMQHALTHAAMGRGPSNPADRLLRFTEIMIPGYWEKPELTDDYAEAWER